MRVYTVAPQKYIRIGPGGGGRSRFERVNVSYSRIKPPQGLVGRQRSNYRRELRPALTPGQREAERAKVASDRLELAHERLRIVVGERPVRACAQLAEPFEGFRRVNPRRPRIEHLPCVLARLDEVPRTP